jgi:hypothetical protein
MIFLGIIFKVRVLNDNYVPGGGAEARAKRGSFSLILGMIKEDIDGFAEPRVEQLACSIGREIVHDNNFQVGDARRADGVQNLFNCPPLVITGNYHGNFHDQVFAGCTMADSRLDAG